jgi:hypothetical protein
VDSLKTIEATTQKSFRAASVLTWSKLNLHLLRIRTIIQTTLSSFLEERGWLRISLVSLTSSTILLLLNMKSSLDTQLCNLALVQNRWLERELSTRGMKLGIPTEKVSKLLE